MANNYSIWLVSPARTRLLLLDRFIRLEYTLTVNAVGMARIDLKHDFDLNRYVQEDTLIEIWRQVPGGKKYLDGDTVWLVRDWQEILSRQGTERVPIIAYSDNEILDRPIIANKSGTSQASKSGQPIDDMMKEIVDEQLGSSATDAARDISTYLSIAADLSEGPTTSKSFSFRNVLTTLRELAQEADEKGIPVFFGVRYTPNGLLTFETSTGQWGVDHTGEDRVILSPQSGTLSDVVRSYETRDERNYIYVGGQNQGASRTINEVSDAERVGISPFNRREYFVDARTANAAELQAEGDAALKAARPREVLNAKIRDSEAIRYGREYGFGDRLIAYFRGRQTQVRLDTVQVLVERGHEEIRANLRADDG